MATWTTPKRLIPELYRTKTITDLSGNIRNWEDVDPDYEIYTDVNGKPITPPSNAPEFGTTGTPMYAGTDLAGAADNEAVRQLQADRYVNEGWGGKQWGKVAGIMGAEAALAGAGAWALGNPVIQGGLNLFGAYEGGKDLFKNNRFGQAWNNATQGKYYSALKDAGIGTLDVLGVSLPAVTAYTKINPLNTYKNARNLYYGIQMKDIGKVSSNPIIHKILDNPITEAFITETNPGKRIIETFMRTSSAPSPIPGAIQGLKQLPWKPRINYIIFGKNPKLRKFFNLPQMHYGDNSWNPERLVFTGLVQSTGTTTILKGYGDIIDAYLYLKRIDPKIATFSSNNDGLLHFSDYINENYLNKKNNILEYEVPGNVDPNLVIKTTEWDGYTGTQFGEFTTNNNKATINVAGHHYQMGWLNPNSRLPQVRRGYDIWKFHPDDYTKKWELGNNYLERRGLELVDRAGTPIIFKQPWKTLY